MNSIKVDKEYKIDRRMKIIQRRSNVAKALSEGKCGGTYYEACILISSIISGIAADIWPGRGIDKKRFVEAWVRYADSSLIPSPRLISTPILVDDLEKAERDQEVNLIKTQYPKIFGNCSQIRMVTSMDCDISEEKLKEICPTLKLRSYSYPVIFYEHVRSHLIHEYKLSNSATARSLFDDEDNGNVGIVYSNTVDLNNPSWLWRQIYFSIPWLLKIVKSIASKTVSFSKSTLLAQPTLWWLEGGSAE